MLYLNDSTKKPRHVLFLLTHRYQDGSEVSKEETTKLKSFLREYSISLYLSPCPFIINMFGIAFETEEYYVFAQEYAPSGDLFDIIPPQVMQRNKPNHDLLPLIFIFHGTQK